jgi:hypothetical protein
VRVVATFVAKNHEIVPALRDDQLLAFYAGERFEGRTGRPPAVRTVAVRGVDEFVRHTVVDGAAKTPSGKRAVARFIRVRHRVFLHALGGRSRGPAAFAVEF